ncbi:MAG: response regulator [Pseudomonadota bacterium]
MSKFATMILNVDDNDGARYVKTRILINAGFHVEEAANGTDALAMARRLLPALVLLDVKLPDINGIEVCRRIKADPATGSILVLQTSAALTGRDDKIRGLEGGADNYLAAPIEADELIANVNALLRLRQTQSDLRNSEERFRQLTDNIEDVFWMFALDGGALLYVSVAYDLIWGRARAALEQTPGDWIGAVHPEDHNEVLTRWNALNHHVHFDHEYRIIQADGGIRWVRDRAFLVDDASGTPYRIARITSDISRRKEMERLLYAADQNKNDFLATLAHELRNPLSPIRSAVGLMGQTKDAAAHDKARLVITRQVDHLTRLVDDLLDVARISEGKLTLRLEEVELHAVLAPALEAANPTLLARGHALEVTLPEQPIWLSGDPVRLAQSIGNLLHNAAKFTLRNGKIQLRVALPDTHRVQISVCDNGIGITSYNLPRIFNMFAQGASASDRAHDGLGIGLSLVSTLVQMHGGRVSASSPGIDQGSTFTIELPLLATKPSTEVDPAQAARPAPPDPGRTLLLVDDNVDSVEIMQQLLSAMGHLVYTANHATTALQMAELHRPDAIILDIGLPDIDGYALARLLRAQPQFAVTRLIAHTGYGSPQDREKTKAAGFDFHLVKPADFEALTRAVNS